MLPCRQVDLQHRLAQLHARVAHQNVDVDPRQCREVIDRLIVQIEGRNLRHLIGRETAPRGCQPSAVAPVQHHPRTGIGQGMRDPKPIPPVAPVTSATRPFGENPS